MADALEAHATVTLAQAQFVRTCARPGVRLDEEVGAAFAIANTTVVTAVERYRHAYDRMLAADWPIPFAALDTAGHQPPLRIDTMPGMFVLYRHQDGKAQSGTGVVAVGFVLPERPNGDTFTCWRPAAAEAASTPAAWSLTLWDSFDHVLGVHGHASGPDGPDTDLVWLIQPAGPAYTTTPERL
ncbi:hypothetical protein [Actinocatenispora rupis]|uniref:Uncharacterized protein n=1 Tax=Actinocatenispora rupis TaxID=519421 RepID=A0A8J3JAQ7_9ACTN|nr:hypothetical protein [Actinocatenispora rupis]GID14896.1 hypothetical protein Aru02nite_57850 [Actinocatenispora rupis]